MRCLRLVVAKYGKGRFRSAVSREDYLVAHQLVNRDFDILYRSVNSVLPDGFDSVDWFVVRDASPVK